MLSLIMLVLLSQSIPPEASKPKPQPMIVNVASVELKDNDGKIHRAESNAVITKTAQTIAMNISK